MRLKWNPAEACFEAEFQDFQGDLESVKAAGFKTSGPPSWTWYTNKIAVLENLRANRPASGLTILTDALVEYKRIKADADAVTALMAELKAAKKIIKRLKQNDGVVIEIPDGAEFGYNCVADSEPTVYVGYVAPTWTGPVCHICRSPVYFYELQNPPTCLSCEIRLDKPPDLF